MLIMLCYAVFAVLGHRSRTRIGHRYGPNLVNQISPYYSALMHVTPMPLSI